MLSIITGERKVTVEYEGAKITFTLAPENLEDQLQALKWAEDRGLLSTEERVDAGGQSGNYFKPSALFSLERINFFRRTKAWDGIAGQDGKPLPCTDEIKVLVFGQQPALIMQLIAQLNEDIAAERKNSQPSQPGLKDTGKKPAKPA
jgi:hypothetical protein